MINPEYRFRFSWKIIFWAPALAILWWALRKAPFHEIGALAATLEPASILLLVGLNILILLGLSGRWKIILRSLGYGISLVRLVSYRLSGFAVSYFTPGTQFGGEPIQAFLLFRANPVPGTDAISSIYLDKLVEVLANFSFLMIGLAITLGNGLFRAKIQAPVEVIALGICLLPFIYFFLLWKGFQPAARIFASLSSTLPHNQFLKTAVRLVRTSEDRIVDLTRRNPALLFKTLGISALVWVLMILEFHFMWMVVGQPLRLVDTISTLTLARIAFLLPLPGGLGALEASQVLAMDVLGHDPAFGLAACLWIRARDITFGMIGFIISFLAVQTEKNKLIEEKK